MDPLSKISQILSHSYSDTKVKELFKIISQTELKNDEISKKKFKIDNVSNIISINTKIIQEFEKIIIELKTFKDYISTIKNLTNEMEKEADIISLKSTHFLKQITTIYDRKILINTKQSLLKSFNNNFIIENEDLEILSSISKPVDERFFKILFKVKQIYLNCQKLLIAGYNKAGVEIMEKMDKYLDTGFEKLCYFIQQELKLAKYKSYEPKDDIKKALYMLSEKHDLFKKCLKTISKERQKFLPENSQFELIHNIPLTSIHQIKIQTYDLLQYTSDMLSWIHQTVVNEKDFFEILFGIHIDSESIKIMNDLPNFCSLSEYKDINKVVFEIIDNNILNSCEIFKIETESIIQDIENIVTIYRIANLIQFYHFTLQKIMPNDSCLLNILRNTEKSVMNAFSKNIQKKLHSIKKSNLFPSPQLEAPSFLINTISELKILHKSIEATHNSSESLENCVKTILKIILDPYCDLCCSISDKLDEPHKSIFLINCWKTCEENISQISPGNSKMQEFKDDINNLFKNLESNQLDYFFNASGLNNLINILESKEEKNLERSLDTVLVETSKNFQNFLPFAITNALDRIKYLEISNATRITNKAAEMFIEKISDLINILPQITDNYQTYFHWTPNEIKLLLGV
ncbi:hypothetical protein PNEG_03277 [Pneumocystis murina B123]|uniref:Conserved oligomeric Golgi complex subunit 6 n=1 Tax=Pneumocystis murina (strain B123) TaxID=1069680 RepID=M7NMJ9_PNEMU|nr:hypothetical protein PNEG_03277 [Pneumocystis murina B123]EMR08447.1 hypothetical protein PNEG_03277 [Pneumocystis murina B123]